MIEWNDNMEEAPRDGTSFLVYEPGDEMYLAGYDSDGVLLAFCGQPVVYPLEPTHWYAINNPEVEVVKEPRPPRVKIYETEEGLDDPAKLWLAIEDAGFKDTVHVGVDWLTAEDLYYMLGHYLENKDVL